MNKSPLPQNPARRRLAKGAMAVPAVLASISTKNALANPIYACTVSGKMSGNMSPGGRVENPSCVSKTPEQWKSYYKTYDPTAAGIPTEFGVSHKTAGSTATRKMVFAQSANIVFAFSPQVTLDGLAAYCNAEGGNYHVKTDEVIDLFEVASGRVPGGYTKNGHRWDQIDCTNYLAMLARGVAFTWVD